MTPSRPIVFSFNDSKRGPSGEEIPEPVRRLPVFAGLADAIQDFLRPGSGDVEAINQPPVAQVITSTLAGCAGSGGETGVTPSVCARIVDG